MRNKFTTSQIALHWLTLLCIFIAWSAIKLCNYVPSNTYWYALLKSIHFGCGSSVLVVMMIRLILRLNSPIPTITPLPPRWQLQLAKLVHGLLYMLFILLPLLGLTACYFFGVNWRFLGIPMPTAETTNKALAGVLINWHKSLIIYGYLLIALHALAALFHHYFLQDNTLIRMLPSHFIKK